MMRTGLGYLVDNFDFSVNIPGINLSLDDLFTKLNIPGFNTGLQDFLDGLLDPLDNFDFSLGLQGLEDWLNLELANLLPLSFPTFALPKFSFGWDGFALGIDFDFDFSLSDIMPNLELDFDVDLQSLLDGLSLPGNFDLSAMGITMDASGKLLVDADLDINLGLDLGLQEYAKAMLSGTPDLKNYIYFADDTGVSLDVTAEGENLNVKALMSITDAIDVGFMVADGSALITAGAGINLNQTSNGRYNLNQINSSVFDSGIGGEATIDLPIYLGATEISPGVYNAFLPMGGTEADLNGDGYGDNVLHAGFDFDLSGITSKEIITPSFGGFNLLNWLDNPQNLLDGLDAFFDGIDDIAATVDSIELPLIGGAQFDGLAQSLRDTRVAVMGDGVASGLRYELQQMIANNEQQVSSVILGKLRQEIFDGLSGIDSEYLSFVTAILDESGDKIFGEDGKVLTKKPQSADDIQLLLTADGERCSDW
jgi:hypothetical protein